MGMYDEIRCLYPLPVEGANSFLYQTKDTKSQFLDLYEIREDGSLWFEEYDIEDHSDPTKEGVFALCGMMTKVNKRWVQEVDFMGEIRFYTFQPTEDIEWIEFSAYFRAGHLQQVNLIKDGAR